MMNPLSSLVSAVGETVGRLTLPAREKKQLETALLEAIYAHAGKLAGEQASVIREEAGGNWLQRSWRPLVMLTFAVIIFAGTFITLPILADTSRFWDLLEIGLDGYVVGRSGEKIAGTLFKLKSKS